MPAPSNIFATLPELLRCLAEQIRGRKQLAKLCLVSRVFNSVIAPFLYHEVDIGETGGIESLRAAAESGYLRHVRKLSVKCGDNCDDYDGYNDIVCQMLPKMPLLRSLAWLTMPMAATVLETLQNSCPAFKAIRIAFPSDMGQKLGYMDDRGSVHPDLSKQAMREAYGTPDLAGFSGLEELTLLDLYEELPWWEKQIVKVLRRLPGLRKLELSLSVETLMHYTIYDEDEKFDCFFDDLCGSYGEIVRGEATAPLLHLQSLRLRTAVLLFDPDSILALTDLTHLEEVHVQNKDVYHFSDTTHFTEITSLYDYDQESGIPFELFGPERCPNLRRFTAYDYRRDVHRAFAAVDDPSWTRQVALSCQVTGRGYEPAQLLRTDANHPALPLHFLMLDIDLIRPFEKVLEDLVSGDEGILEGLTIQLDEIPGGFEHVDLLVNALSKLANLTQLAVTPNLILTQLSNETVVDLSHRLAAAPPRLRYLKFYGHSWRVWRNKDHTIILEELEDREISDVELFSQTIWRP